MIEQALIPAGRAPPSDELRPMPTDVLDRYDDFERGRWYSGWRKSVLPIAAFDARATE